MPEITQQQDGERTLLGLQGELNIYSAAEMRQELLHNLNRNSQLEVDLAGVSDFDSAGVQILLVLKREALRLGKQLSFVHHSPAVREVLDLLNLVGELGDPLVIPHNAQGGRP